VSKRASWTGWVTLLLLVADGLLSILLASCGGEADRAEQSASVPTEEASLTDLASVEDFTMLFNRKEGVPRLVLLLSPT
jgi:hypothetical protein